MGYRSKTSFVMRVPVPDLVDYSWLVPGISDCLLMIDQVIRKQKHTDDIRYIITLLNRIAGALDIIGECALQTVFKKIILALSGKGNLSTWMTTKKSLAMRRFMYAVMEYLESIRSGIYSPVLYLYPYYREMMEAVEAKRIHPADLYYAQSSTQLLLIEKDNLEEMHPYKKSDYALLKSEFEKEFRLYMQHFGVVNKERTHILSMHKLLGRLVEAQESLEGRAFWGVVLGFSESVALKKIDNDHYVQQLYQLIAEHLRQSFTGTIVLHQTLLMDALFFIAHVNAEEDSVVEKIKMLYEMPAVSDVDYKQSRYMGIDPVVLASLKDKLNQLQSMWNGVVNGVAQYEKSFVKAIEGLKDQGEMLGSQDMAELFNVLRRSTLSIVRNRSELSVKLEVTRNLLFVEASLYAIYRLPANFSNMVQDSSLRLASSFDKKYVVEQLASLKKMTGDEHYTKTKKIVADEILSHLQQLEELLQQLLFAPGNRSHLHKTNALLDSLESIFLMLNYQEAHKAVAYAKKMIVVMCDDVFDRKKLWCMMNNMGILSFFAREIRNMSYLKDNMLLFDAKTGMLMTGDVKGAEVVWRPHPENFDLHCAGLLQHSSIAQQIFLEDDMNELEKMPSVTDSALDSFLCELEDIVDDVNCILPLSRISPEDLGHIETLHHVFLMLENKSRMAGVNEMSDAAMEIAHTLNRWIAEDKTGSSELYVLLEHAGVLIAEWLQEMRLQGQSHKSFTMLGVAANSLHNGHGILKTDSH